MQDDDEQNDLGSTQELTVKSVGRSATLSATISAAVVVPAIVADAGEHATRRVTASPPSVIIHLG